MRVYPRSCVEVEPLSAEPDESVSTFCELEFGGLEAYVGVEDETVEIGFSETEGTWTGTQERPLLEDEVGYEEEGSGIFAVYSFLRHCGWCVVYVKRNKVMKFFFFFRKCVVPF